MLIGTYITTPVDGSPENDDRDSTTGEMDALFGEKERLGLCNTVRK